MPGLQVIITSSADKDETKIYKYISDEFGELYAEKFRNKLIELFQALSNHPLIGRPAKTNPSVRVIIINNRNKLVYKIVDDTVIILRLLNTKTNLSQKF